MAVTVNKNSKLASRYWSHLIYILAMLFLKSWCELTQRHDDDVTDGCSDGAVGIQTDAFTMAFDFVIKTHTEKIHTL